MNDENLVRASAAAQCLTLFQKITGSEEQDAVCDLLADLMHLCDLMPQRFGRFQAEVRRADDHYNAEVEG